MLELELDLVPGWFVVMHTYYTTVRCHCTVTCHIIHELREGWYLFKTQHWRNHLVAVKFLSIFICPESTKTIWQSHTADRTVRLQWYIYRSLP